jgi:hypothetical protein
MNAPASATGEQGVCECCGAPARFQSTEATCEFGDDARSDEHSCAVTVSRSLCIHCAKAEGVYPEWYVRLPVYVVGVLLYIALRPFRRTLRRRVQQQVKDQSREPHES